MEKRVKWVGALATLGVLLVGVAAVSIRAAAQDTSPPAASTPAVPEESATIRDDPTIAPDSHEAADNAQSFPTDI